MSDVIGDGFAKRKIKGLKGLSFASYEFGWLDCLENSRKNKSITNELINALQLLHQHTAIWNNPCTGKDAEVNALVEKALAKARGEAIHATK